MEEKELDRTKCPICNGTGHAIMDPSKKCNVCEGYGVPVWSDEFQGLVAEGKISSPPKPVRKYTEALRVALLSSDFNNFQRRIRHIGMKEVYLPELRRKVNTWNKTNSNKLDIPWLFAKNDSTWLPAERAIVASARGYRHYEILINEYNQANGTTLSVRTRHAVSTWRYVNEVEFRWKGNSFMAEKLNKNGKRTGELLIFHGFVKFHRAIGKPSSPLRSGVWLLTDAETDGLMGTTVDFLRYTEIFGRKVGKRIYLKWLSGEKAT